MRGDTRTWLKDRFCPEPFAHFEILFDGSVAPCCSIWNRERMGNVFVQGLEEIWNGNRAAAIRRSILDADFRFCQFDVCALIVNRTLPRRDDVEDPFLRDIIDNDRVTLGEPPRHIFLAEDTTCNLACPSCRSGIQVADARRRRDLDRIVDEIVRPALAALRPMELSISGQGDPWASPHYRDLLRHLSDHDCGDVTLAIFSNGQLMSEERWRDYKGLERYRPVVSISTDAASSFTYAKVRPPGRWERLIRNLEFLATLRRQSLLRQFTVSMTIQADNYVEMAALARLAKSLGCDHVRFNLILPTGPHLDGSFQTRDVANPDHPEHEAFLWELRDPIFDDPICRLFDVRALRDKALAIRQQPSHPLAVLVANRLRDGETAEGRGGEGATLLEMARPWRAAQRYLRAIELDPTPSRHLDAGIALLLAGMPADAILHLLIGRSASLSEDERVSVEACIGRAQAALTGHPEGQIPLPAAC